MLKVNAVERREDGPIKYGYEDAQDLRLSLFAGDVPRVERIRRRIRIMHPDGLARFYRGEILGLHSWKL